MKPTKRSIVDSIFSGNLAQSQQLMSAHIQTLKNQLSEQIEQNLMEIKWNSPEVVNTALSAPIECGFEAETVWHLYAETPDVGYMDEYDIRDNYPGIWQDILADYEDWVVGTEEWADSFNNIMAERRADWVDRHTDDEDLRQEFRDDVELDSDDEIDSEEFESWLEEYFDRDVQDDLEEDVHDEATAEVQRDLSVDDFAEQRFGGFAELLDYHGVSPNNSIESIADEIAEWAKTDSKFTDVQHGEYHSTNSSRTNTWRVETDGSIEGDGSQGAEIISPVYDSPEEMLAEMQSLFEYFRDNEVGTNESTGLHVTMSMADYTRDEPNRVKMAVMLDDEYLLKQFSREYNNFTPSQQKKLKDKVRTSLKAGDRRTATSLEYILEPVLNKDRGSIHFKTGGMGSEKLNDAGNQMVEFRIAGNENYEQKFEEVKSAVVRYATTMLLGYDEDLYRREYLTKLGRLVNKAMDLDVEGDVGEIAPAMKALLQVVRELKITANFEALRDSINHQQYDLALAEVVRMVSKDRNQVAPGARVRRLMIGILKDLEMTPEDVVKAAQGRGITVSPSDQADFAGALSDMIGQELEIPEHEKFQSQTGNVLVSGHILASLLKPGQRPVFYESGLALDVSPQQMEVFDSIDTPAPDTWDGSEDAQRVSRAVGVTVGYPISRIENYKFLKIEPNKFYLVNEENSGELFLNRLDSLGITL